LGPGLKSINYALLFLGCVIFHTISTWTLPLIDRDEPRFAEASREMIERCDFVVPYFNNHFRFDKPPLTYWAQIASYKVFGENDFAARFPSAIAAGLAAVSLAAWGRRIGGAQAGWWAAIIFTLSLLTFYMAKAAVADMWLVLFVTIAHWSGYELLFQKRSTSNAEPPTPNFQWIWWLTFYLSLALGFLAKGPIAWTPLLTLAALRYFSRGAELASRFKFVRGILLMLAIVAVWGVPALIQTHGEFLRIGIGRHVIGRSIGAMEGHGGNSFGIYLLLLPFYFVTVFLSFLPWSIKLPKLVRRLWSTRDPIDNYLIAGAAVIFIIFSLIKTKLPHYILPAFPLLSLLVVRHVIEQPRFLRNAAVSAVSLYVAIALIVPPLAAGSFFPAFALFEKSRSTLKPEMEFGALDYQEPSLVWYFRARVHGFFTPQNKKTAAEFMTKAGPRFLILPTNAVAEIFPTPPANWTTYSTTGFNIAKGKQIDLTLVLKPE